MSERRTVVVLDAEFAASLPVRDDVRVVGREALDDDATRTSVAAVVTQFDPVDGTLLDRLPNLAAVVKMGQSYHNVDVDALRARGVPGYVTPRKGPNCVAELAMTLMLALSKDLLVSHRSVAEGAYRLRGLTPERSEQWKMAFHWMRHTTLHEVRGKTVGIVGMGEIGCELALRANAMGMRVLYTKRSPLSTELEARFRASYRSLDALLDESDYVVLAVPHTPDTERMIGVEQLARMRRSAFLVNVCRGGVVDEEALIEALSTRRIAGVGLDVFTYEPLPADSPLCRLDNVILTPHVGGGTGSNRALEVGEALDATVEALSGREGGAAWRIA